MIETQSSSTILMFLILTSPFPHLGTNVTTTLSSPSTSKSSNKSVNPSLKQLLIFFFLFPCDQ